MNNFKTEDGLKDGSVMQRILNKIFSLWVVRDFLVGSSTYTNEISEACGFGKVLHPYTLHLDGEIICSYISDMIV